MSARSVRSIALLAAAAVTSTTVVATAPAAHAATATARQATTVVSRADIDGDGRPDVTTLTSQRKGAVQVLRTTTANGHTSSVRVSTPWLLGAAPFKGTAAIDGRKGSELVLLTSAGAHTQYFRVYTWRGGRLVAEKDPATRSAEWVTDGALSSSMGYTVRTVKGVRQLTSVSLGRDSWEADATFSGRRVTSQWKNGRWVRITDRAIVVPDSPAVWNGSGWNVAGLPRF